MRCGFGSGRRGRRPTGTSNGSQRLARQRRTNGRTHQRRPSPHPICAVVGRRRPTDDGSTFRCGLPTRQRRDKGRATGAGSVIPGRGYARGERRACVERWDAVPGQHPWRPPVMVRGLDQAIISVGLAQVPDHRREPLAVRGRDRGLAPVATTGGAAPDESGHLPPGRLDRLLRLVSPQPGELQRVVRPLLAEAITIRPRSPTICAPPRTGAAPGGPSRL
jgi:hypothetical protein